MPAAICTRCKDVIHWRNQRGARIANFKCPKCGGPYQSAIWKDAGYQARESGKGKGNTGRKKAPCAICGKNCIAAPATEPVTVTLYGRWFSYQMPVVIEPDDVVCRRHCVRAPWSSATLYHYDFDRETADWLQWQINGVGVSYVLIAD